jgi:plasmid stabilization system protein ParE
MNYRLLSPATIELAEATTYYENEVKGLGLDFLDEFEVTIKRILDFTSAWSKLDGNLHYCLLQKFPYMIIYKIHNSEILVVSIFHQHRKPKSWKDNL